MNKEILGFITCILYYYIFKGNLFSDNLYTLSVIKCPKLLIIEG